MGTRIGGRSYSYGRDERTAADAILRRACSVLSVYTVEIIAVMLLLLVLALATLPMWPYSTKWTYYPAVGCGLAGTLIAFLTLGGRL
jgi:hypothetical protein